MNKLFERLYELSPGFIKDTMVYGYGFILWRQRYTGKFHEYLSEQIDCLSRPREYLLDMQNRRLRLMIAHAYNNVPYYRELFNQMGLSPKDINKPDDLQRLPILEKSMLRERPDGLLAQNMSKSKYILQNTSGTTGTPLNLYNTLDGLRYSHALEFLVRHVYGVFLKSKQASLIGRIVIPYHQKQPPFWRFNPWLNQYLFSSYHMNEVNLPHYIDKLVEFQPEEIVGYPSSLYVLARFIVENNITTVRPKAVFGNSEPILAYQREVMEKAFQCPVREWYSSTEQAFFAFECPHGNYHIFHPYGVVEIVDDTGHVLRDGTPGQLICTGLTNYAMPLIRYRIGDSATVGSIECPCGNKGKVFTTIVGRTDDILVTPDGNYIGRLDPVFKGLNGIQECQIIQKAIDTFLVKLVKDLTFTKNDEKMLISSLIARIGSDNKIEIAYVDAIPREENGKFRAVISEIKAGIQ